MLARAGVMRLDARIASALLLDARSGSRGVVLFVVLVALLALTPGLASKPAVAAPSSPASPSPLASPTSNLQAAVQAEYDAIGRLRRDGKKREAAEAFVAFAARHPTSTLAPRALTAAATIHHWDLAEPARALELYDRVLAAGSALGEGGDERGDRSGGVASALRGRLALARAAGGPATELGVLRGLLVRRWDDDLAGFMRLRAARILADDLADPEGALKQLAAVRALHRSSGRSDEAAMFEGELLRRVGRPEAALLAYRAILRTKRTSLFVGDYNSTRLDDAYFAIAETHRRDLGDARAAEEAYLELVEARPLSRLVDDALAQAADLAEARGDLAAARERRERLAKLAPESKYLSRRRTP